MKAYKVLNLGLVLASVTFAGVLASAVNGQTDNVFDGKSLVCAEKADVGNPGVVIKKINQVTQADGILVTLQVTSTVCTEASGQFIIKKSKPVQVLSSGVVLSEHEVVVTSDSSKTPLTIFGAAEISLNSATTEVDILVPRSLKLNKIDSFMRVKLVDTEGPTKVSFGEFRHQIK